MLNFYWRYIPNCEEIVAPISDMTKESCTKCCWMGWKAGESFYPN